MVSWPSPAEALVAAGAGVGAGIVSGLFGVGGGIVAVPLGVYFMDMTFHEAKAAALIVLIFAGSTALARHGSAGNVLWRHGVALTAGGVFGAILSSVLAEDVSDGALGLAFGVLLIVVALRLMMPEPAPRAREAPLALFVPLGFVGGIMTGFFGVGGGIIMVPGMVVLGVSMHNAVATSLIAVAVNGLVAAATQAGLGYGSSMLAVGVPLALGAVVGGFFGATLALRTPAKRLRLAFAVGLVIVGLTFIF